MDVHLAILIVEDNPLDAELLAHALQRDGLDFTWQRVETKQAYLAHLDPPPDIVLSDYHLPQFDAPEALRILQEHSLDIPFIVVSGTIGEDAAVACMRDGATDYLLKDRLGRLGAAVRQALEAKRLRDGQRAEETARHEAEEALLRGEEQYRRIVETAHEGIWLVDPDLRITFANARMAEMLGYTLEELLGASVYTFLDRDEHDQLDRRAQRRREGIQEEVEVRYRHKDGTLLWLLASTSSFFDAAGRYAGALGMFTDITARKQAEQTLGFQAHLLDAVGQAVIVTGLDGTIQYWNRAAELLYGWTAAEVLGTTVNHLLVTPNNQERAEAITATLRLGGSWSGEFTVQRRDGSAFPALVTDSPIMDEAGVLRGIIGISTDLSDLKRAEEALRASEAWFRSLSEHATDLIAVQDADGIISYASPSHLSVLGYAPQELVGRHILPHVHPDDAPDLLQLWTRLLTTGDPVWAEFRLQRRDGVWLTMEATGVNRLADPAVRGIITTTRDVTTRHEAEVALRSSETRFRSLYEHAPIGITLLDMQGHCLMANKAMQDILGYDEHDLRGIPFTGFTHPDDVAVNWSLFQEVLAGARDSYTLERRYLRKDGRLMWGQLSVSASRDEAGAPYSIIGMLLDVTERKQAEAARERLAAIVDSTEDAIIGMTPEGVLDSWNAGATQLYGYTPDEVIGRSVSFLAPPDRVGEALSILDQQRRRAGATRYETVRLHKDGHALDVAVTMSAIRDGTGALVGAATITRDITAQQQALRAAEQGRAAAIELAQLRAERAREMQALSDLTTTIAQELEPEKLYSLILEQAVRLLPCDFARVRLYQDGWVVVVATWGEPSVPVGTRLFPLLNAEGEWMPIARERVVSIPDTSKVPIWVALLPSDGALQACSSLIVPITIDEQPFGSVMVNSRQPHAYSEHHVRIATLIGERVTLALHNARLYQAEQQRARDAEELARLRNDFVASVSHELRTPLTAILGYAELLQDRWPTLSEAQRRGQVDRIVRAANRQHHLVEDLLLLTRLETDVPALQTAPVRLSSVVGHAADEIRMVYRNQTMDLTGDSGIQVLADPERVTQIVANLLDNAAKYSPEGAPIHVWWRREDGNVLLRVRDHGAGVPEQTMPYLFTRFGRGLNSRIRAGHVGTGIGLYLSRRLAEAMQGSLDLEETGSTGSTFTLRLPGVSMGPLGY